LFAEVGQPCREPAAGSRLQQAQRQPHWAPPAAAAAAAAAGAAIAAAAAAALP